jgi:Dynein light chain type 1
VFAVVAYETVTVAALRLFCLQVIKDGFDRKFGGSPWCVVAGKDFSFEVTHAKNYLLLFIGAFHVGILAWKL